MEPVRGVDVPVVAAAAAYPPGRSVCLRLLPSADGAGDLLQIYFDSHFCPAAARSEGPPAVLTQQRRGTEVSTNRFSVLPLGIVLVAHPVWALLVSIRHRPLLFAAIRFPDAALCGHPVLGCQLNYTITTIKVNVFKEVGIKWF